MISPWRWRPRVMKQNQKRNAKGRAAKSVLRLPDLEVAKSAVLHTLSCPDAQRGYRHAIDEFVDWYCSEPRLSFSKTVVIRYRCTWSRGISPFDDRSGCGASGVAVGATAADSDE